MKKDTHRYLSDFARRYYTEGREDGKVEAKFEALLLVLAARGIVAPEAERDRIFACMDPAQIDRWIVLAAHVSSVEQLC